MADMQNFKGLSTKGKWRSLKRGDIIQLEGQKDQLIVQHTLKVGYEHLVITANVVFSFHEDKLESTYPNFEVVGHYLLTKETVVR